MEQTEIVDCIGVEKGSGGITLAISDHLDWSDEKAHLRLLQEKINAYLRFVESGEIYDTYPEAKGKSITFDIIAQFDLSESARAFLAKSALQN